MKLYGYDDNGFFTGSFDAQVNPMGYLPGEPRFFTARNSTEIPPPELQDGMVLQFVNGAWNQVVDPMIKILADQKVLADSAAAAELDAQKAATNSNLLSQVSPTGVAQFELNASGDAVTRDPAAISADEKAIVDAKAAYDLAKQIRATNRASAIRKISAICNLTQAEVDSL